jgi:glycosyltransferase involved in cell wall biosynthesis
LQPLVSVIVPAYNLETLLNRSVQSILQQTYHNLEVIIVDDGSTDQTSAVAQEFARLDSRVQLVQMPTNVGISRTRNAGLAAATGDFLAFADGDDWVEPNQIEWYMDQFAAHPEVAMVSCGFIKEPLGKRSRIRKRGIVDQKTMVNYVNRMNSPIGGYLWNKCYRRALISKHRLRFDTDVALMEDQLFNTRYILLGDYYYLSNEPLYHYVQRDDSAIHKGINRAKKARDIVVVNARIQHVINVARANQDRSRAHKKALTNKVNINE